MVCVLNFNGGATILTSTDIHCLSVQYMACDVCVFSVCAGTCIYVCASEPLTAGRGGSSDFEVSNTFQHWRNLLTVCILRM